MLRRLSLKMSSACWHLKRDGRVRQDALRVASGVPVGQSDWSALLEKPNPDIVKGDFLKRADGIEFRVENIISMTGSPVMQLQLKQQGVL